ncbi:MAG: ABC transporter ATP-binding protein [Alkaliphilus sp.]|nr:ABC transporter ATP-binding protein [Alkaliphilus sp.]
MEKLLDVKDLAVSFRTYFGEIEAVRGISFHVNKGETVAIVGESGCGKSVTSNSLMQLLQMPPAYYKRGKILFQGENIIKKSEKEMQDIRGNKISMIFQDPMASLNPTMKVGKQIIEGIVKRQGLGKNKARKKAIEMLESVSVPQSNKRIGQYPHELSIGMCQRVMIAIAMISNPKLLIADEPTTALDVTVQAQILDIMKDIQKKSQTSIILITHDLGIVADMSDRIIVMYAGKFMEEGNVMEVFNNPMHPYTGKLLGSVPGLNINKFEPLHSIEGSPPDLYKPPTGCPFFDRCDEAMYICKDNVPERTYHSDTHYSCCWLNHPMAKDAAEGGEI